MESVSKKPHVLCIPYPAQSHIKAMLKLAKVLHTRGVEITFVNTEYNHKRFLKSGGLDTFASMPDFRFLGIPDGIPENPDLDATQDRFALSNSVQNYLLGPFSELLQKIPPVTCVISDGCMTFTIDAGEKFGIPVVLFWTIAACAFMGYYHFLDLREKGLLPVKDEKGYLDTKIDWIPGMKDLRLKDIPSINLPTNEYDAMFNFIVKATQRSCTCSANIIHTFDELEPDIIKSLNNMISKVYTIGPLQLLLNQAPKEENVDSVKYSLWKEEPLCLKWLDSREPHSVIYVNFGSVAVMSSEIVVELVRGLANSKQYFLMIIRPDLVKGETKSLSSELLELTKERGFIASWCPQEEVLNHPSIGGFLTHCGWGSTIESLSAGVPMICMPFFADQPTNCKYACNEWGVGLEIDVDFKSEDVEKAARELMEGLKGKEMKKNAMVWKEKAQMATGANGSSSFNLDMFVNKLFGN